MKKTLIIVLMALLLGILPASLAATASDNVTIVVSISSSTLISVTPETLTWSNVPPGTVGSEYNLNIRNIGSTNVTNLEAELNTTEVESSNPLTTPDA